MNKAQLIEALSVHFDGNKAEAGRALKAVLDTITAETVKGERVALTGFGVFEKVHRPARMVRNPATGESKKAKATYVPRFRAGQELKDLVSGAKKLPKAGAAKPAAKAPAKTAAKAAPAKATVKTPAKTAAKTPAKKSATRKPATT